MPDEDNSSRFFSSSQKRIISTGATLLAIAVVLAAIYFSFRLLQDFVTTFSNVLMPLAIAGILAMLLRPVVCIIERFLRLSRLKSIILLYALMLVVLAAAFFIALPIVSAQIIDLIDYLPQFAEKTQAYLSQQFPELVNRLQHAIGEDTFNKYADQASESLKKLLGKAFGSVGAVGTHIISMFATLAAYAVVPVYLFFLLGTERNYSKDMEQELSFIKENWRKDLLFLASQFVEILVAFFRGQIVIGMILAVILAAGFSLVGLEFGLILGIIIGLLNIVPYLGTIIGATVVLPIAYFQPEGGLVLIGLCVLVFVIGQLITDYVLTPRIMGKQTGMNPMLIIFSIFFWGTALGGILGMVLAIPLTAFFLIFWRLLKHQYLPKLIKSAKAEEPADAEPESN